MGKHYYACARLSQSTPAVAFCFESKKERDAFVKRYNKESTHPLLTAGAPTADYVKGWRKYRRGIHFLYMVSGEKLHWRNITELAPKFYAIGRGNWPQGQPYPTYPY